MEQFINNLQEAIVPFLAIIAHAGLVFILVQIIMYFFGDKLTKWLMGGDK